MRSRPMNLQIANDWNLWCEYVNPDGAQTRAEWNYLTLGQRIDLMYTIWPECKEEPAGPNASTLFTNINLRYAVVDRNGDYLDAEGQFGSLDNAQLLSQTLWEDWEMWNEIPVGGGQVAFYLQPVEAPFMLNLV